MVNLKQLAAIAITLIVVVPIALGYALSIEEEQTTAMESADSWSLTNLITNHESPYYNDGYTGVPNNQSVLSGTSSSVLDQVEYLTVGSNPTSYPSMTTASGTAALGTTTTQVETMAAGGTVSVNSLSDTVTASGSQTVQTGITIGNTETIQADYYRTLDPTIDFAPDAASLEMTGSWTVTTEGNQIVSYTGSGTLTAVRVSDDHYYYTCTGASSPWEGGSTIVRWTADGTYRATACSAQAMPSGSWSVTLPQGVLHIVTGSSETWYSISDRTTVYHRPSAVSIGAATFSDVTAVSFAAVSADSVQCLVTTSIGYRSAGTQPDVSAGVHDVYRMTISGTLAWTLSLYQGDDLTEISNTSVQLEIVRTARDAWTATLSDGTSQRCTGWILQFTPSMASNTRVAALCYDVVEQAAGFTATLSDALIRVYTTSSSTMPGYIAVTDATAVTWDPAAQHLSVGSTQHSTISRVAIASTAGQSLSIYRSSVSVGNSDSDVPPIAAHDAYLITVPSTYEGTWTLTLGHGSGASDSATGTGWGSITAYRDSASTWSVVSSSDTSRTYTGCTSWSLAASTGSTNVYVSMSDIQALDITASTWSANLSGALRATMGDTTTWIPLHSVETVTMSGNALVTSAGQFTVESLALASPNVTQVSYSYETAQDDGYGDPTDGWRLPVSPARWFNLQQNRSVDWFLQLPGGASASLQTSGATVQISRSATGSVTVNGSQLGQYEYLEVVVAADSITVYGVPAWPTMGGSASRMASVSVESDGADFQYVTLTGSTAVWRVDSARVVAGTYATTYDYLLDLSDQFPTVENSLVQINSVAVYGDALTIAGTRYDVTDGSITVHDADSGRDYPVRVRQMTVTAIQGTNSYGDTIYRTTVSGHSVGDTTTAGGGIMFNGEWSLTATLWGLEEVQRTSMEWQPGGFGLDEEGVLAAAMLTAVGAFVVLGMTGRASGPKAALLALVCGGAVAVLMIII